MTRRREPGADIRFTKRKERELQALRDDHNRRRKVTKLDYMTKEQIKMLLWFVGDQCGQPEKFHKIKSLTYFLNNFRSPEDQISQNLVSGVITGKSKSSRVAEDIWRIIKKCAMFKNSTALKKRYNNWKENKRIDGKGRSRTKCGNHIIYIPASDRK